MTLRELLDRMLAAVRAAGERRVEVLDSQVLDVEEAVAVICIEIQEDVEASG